MYTQTHTQTQTHTDMHRHIQHTHTRQNNVHTDTHRHRHTQTCIGTYGIHTGAHEHRHTQTHGHTHAISNYRVIHCPVCRITAGHRTFSDQFCYLTGQFYTCAVMMSAHYIIKVLASSANYNLLSSLALSIVRLRANCLHNCANCLHNCANCLHNCANCISARRLN